jgi:hypothetical protein
MSRRLFSCCLVLFFSVGMLFASLEEVKTLYYSGAYKETIRKARETIEGTPDIEPDAVLELRKYVAFSLVALEEEEEAEQEFLTILRGDSTVSLDPQLVSPKIVAVFNRARERFAKSAQVPDNLGDTAVLNPVSPLKLRTAVFRSMAFPGMGQIYSGQRAKGWSLIVAEGVALSGLVISHFFCYKAHQAYLDARDPALIGEKYEIYNNWYVARNAFGGLSIGIWVSAPLEILIFPPRWGKDR